MQDHLQDRQPVDDRPVTDRPSRRRLPIGVMAGLSAAVLAAGGGTAWWTLNSLQTRTPDQPVVEEPVDSTPSVESPTSEQPPTTALVETAAQVYWVEVAGTEFELVPAGVMAETASDPEVVLTAAFDSLLDGPDEAAGFSEIPEGTELLDLSVEADGVYVNLSEDFQVGGGSASMMGRLGQVIYTASSLEPAEPVWLSIEGEPIEYLGGEGIPVDQPMTREDFQTLPF
ncbi:MAG: GerMN domain-containing protein [Synechococcales bacterium]|nr:GerMN domain-containing protein [Synechococcales bacterium]